jgi:hypothetical protein
VSPTITRATPDWRPSGSPHLAARHASGESQEPCAGGNPLPDDHPAHDDAQLAPVVGNHLASDRRRPEPQTSHVTGNHLDPDDHTAPENHGWPVVGVDQHARPTVVNTTPVAGPSGGQQHYRAEDALLGLTAQTLDDIEKVRIATQNRIGALEREGLGDLATTDQLRVQLLEIARIEHELTLTLRRALRTHRLGPWVKRTVGVGEKQGARLIAAIGDPAWNDADKRPRRGPAELWAYCGFAPGQRRQKGVKNNWNTTAKMRAFLVAESCIKQRHSPYRTDYETARAKWVEHDTSDAHKHAHALRVVAKAVLRDLWIEARDLESQECQ